MEKSLVALALAVIVSACSKVSEKAGETIDSGARKVGKTATDIVNSIDKGVSESAEISIGISDALAKGGLESGKYYIRKDKDGNENILSVYLITNQDTDRELHAKLFDKKHVEMGRATVLLKQKKGEAAYWDFVFDPKISFEFQSTLIVE